MLAWLLKFVSGGVVQTLAEAYRAREQAKTDAERIAADVRIVQLEGQRDVLVAGNRWLQWLFAVPLGFWFTAVVLDSVFLFEWNVAALPPPLDEWAGIIISALFLADAANRITAQITRRR